MSGPPGIIRSNSKHSPSSAKKALRDFLLVPLNTRYI